MIFGPKKQTVGVIFAMSEKGIIGNKGDLPWKHLPGELRTFQKVTKDSVVIMGRKTRASLPLGYLPNRVNIIIGNEGYDEWAAGKPSPGNAQVHWVRDIPTALRVAESYAPRGWEKVWFIGGKRIIEDAMAFAGIAVVTVVHGDYHGDVSVDIDLNDKDWSRMNRITEYGESAFPGLGIPLYTTTEHHRILTGEVDDKQAAS